MKETQSIRFYQMLLISCLILKWKAPQYIINRFEDNNVIEQINDASIFNIMDATEQYCKIGSEFYPEIE